MSFRWSDTLQKSSSTRRVQACAHIMISQLIPPSSAVAVSRRTSPPASCLLSRLSKPRIRSKPNHSDSDAASDNSISRELRHTHACFSTFTDNKGTPVAVAEVPTVVISYPWQTMKSFKRKGERKSIDQSRESKYSVRVITSITSRF